AGCRAPRLVRVGYPAPEAVAGVRGHRGDLLLRGIQPVGEAPLALHPECLVETQLERLCLLEQCLSTWLVTQHPVDLGHAQLRVIDIALQLAEALGLLHLAAVGVDDRLARVLPADVLVTER